MPAFLVPEKVLCKFGNHGYIHWDESGSIDQGDQSSCLILFIDSVTKMMLGWWLAE